MSEAEAEGHDGPHPATAILFLIVPFTVGLATKQFLSWVPIPLTGLLLVRCIGSGRAAAAAAVKYRDSRAQRERALAAPPAATRLISSSKPVLTAALNPSSYTHTPSAHRLQVWGMCIGALQAIPPITQQFTDCLTIWMVRQ